MIEEFPGGGRVATNGKFLKNWVTQALRVLGLRLLLREVESEMNRRWQMVSANTWSPPPVPDFVSLATGREGRKERKKERGREERIGKQSKARIF